MHVASFICEAIRARRRLSFDYDGLPRVVEPYVHGVTRTGAEALRAVQVAGESRSGRGRKASGKLWLVEKMGALRITGELFVPNDPRYQPLDKAMWHIHCRV
jgi:hypothetical protein